MHHLNYCRQMTKQFMATLAVPAITTESRTALSHAIDLVTASKKFILPTGGRLYDDKEYRALDESQELRLPYPMIALEYEFPLGFEGAAPGVGETSSSKRIIFARERDGFIVITPVPWFDANGMWVYFYECAIPTRNYLDRTKRQNGRVATLAKREREEIPMSDYADEIGVVLCFLNALQCANVSVEPSPVSKVKKAMRKALPFDDYHVLTVRQHAPSANAEVVGDTRSPREHLRRGHIRKYESGLKIWVNATVVNAGVGGVVTKDYRLKSA